MRLLSPAALLLTAIAIASPSSASDSGPRPVKRYHVQTPRSSVKAGAAKTKVRAPMAVVRKVVTDYNHYGDYISKFKKARIVGKSGDKTDVYLQVPILKGLANVWAVVRFGPIQKAEDGTERVIGRMVKGNVKRLDAEWRLSKIAQDETHLDLQLLIVPDLPAPGSLVTGEVAYAADKAVQGLRNQSEKLHASR